MLQLLTLVVTAIAIANPLAVPRPVAAGPLSDSTVAYLLTDPERRVRAFAPHLRHGVAEGLRRSPTFAGMLLALEESDVIVQVVQTLGLPASTHAQLVFVNGQRTHRFLRIQVAHTRRGDDLIAVLGHELFHALEIAAAPDVRDENALAAHYGRIGFSTGHERHFDTHDARAVERQVRFELGRTN